MFDIREVRAKIHSGIARYYLQPIFTVTVIPQCIVWFPHRLWLLHFAVLENMSCSRRSAFGRIKYGAGEGLINQACQRRVVETAKQLHFPCAPRPQSAVKRRTIFCLQVAKITRQSRVHYRQDRWEYLQRGEGRNN